MPSRFRDPPPGVSTSSAGEDTESSRRENDMGLATYTHDRDQPLTTRSFYFRDEDIRAFSVNTGYPVDRDPDQHSDGTSFEGLDSLQNPRRVAHCSKATKVDRKSDAFNGDISRVQDPSVSREHHLHGGSVSNASRLVNGDMDVDAFLAYFCTPREAPQAGRRTGRRAGPTSNPQSRN